MNSKVLRGNIADARVDAVVLPANSKLKEGSGASEAIFEAAGRKLLTKKCKEIGSCETGSAVPTLGYNLDSKYIIHAVVPRWKDGNHDEYNLLSSAYVSALKLADVMECKSIAFPLLASGNNGFDIELAYEIAKKNIELFEAEHLEDVILVVYGNRVADLIQKDGFDIGMLPRNMEKDEQEFKNHERRVRLFGGAKEVAVDFIDEQLEKGIEYFKDPENREKAVQAGTKIVKMAISLLNK